MSARRLPGPYRPGPRPSGQPLAPRILLVTRT